MDTRALARRLLGLAATSLLSGCEVPSAEPEQLDPLPIRHETDEVEVATAFDPPLCEGDLRWLDMHTARVEELLGLSGERLRTIYAYDEDDVIIRNDDNEFFIQIPGCPRNVLGCFHRDERIAVGAPQSLPHELAHSVSNDLDLTYTRFWYEGLAEALSENPIVYIPSELVVEAASDDVLYPIAAHFIRWLIRRDGIDPVIRAFEGDPFDEVYGMSLAEMEQIYDAEAPEVLPSPFACADEPLLPAEDGSFGLETDLDCASPSTTRIRHRLGFDHVATIRTITTEADATYVVESEGLHQVRIGGCQTEPGDLFEQLGDVANDASPIAGLNPPFTTEIRTGQEVFLPAATYRVVLIANDMGAPQPIQFTLTLTE